MRTSLYLQRLSFTIAVILPLSAIIIGWQQELFYLTGYAWAIGFVSSIWHRVTVEDDKR